MEVKVCRTCGEEKSISDFYFSKKRTKHMSECKPCCKVRVKKWKDNNKDRAAHIQKRINIKYRYGISGDEYEAILAAQNNRCAVCNVEFEGTRSLNSPSIDHNHSTGAIRDIICGGCNRAIGLAKECPDRLRAAADYLERHRA